MTEKIYLVKENFWNGEICEESVSWEKIKKAFNTPTKAKAYIRHKKKVAKLNAHKNGNKIRITADKKGTHIIIADEYGESYVDWAVTEITVR